MPVLTVFAGPNGSGKSSVIQRVDFEGRENLLEADAIARRINPDAPDRGAIRAGREILRRTDELVDSGEDFAIETTLAGRWTASAIRAALEGAFFVRLVYICVESPELSIRRVQERVAQGGHDVPVEDVRRRYARSLTNLKEVIGVVHQAFVYDNSGANPKLVIEIRSGVLVQSAGDLPGWATEVIRGLA